MYRSTRAVLFSSTHLSTCTHGALIGSRVHVYTQNIHVSIFRANKIACTRRAKHE